ncbi:AAA family ATPase [Candidatus Sulfurimonas marisnigri]|uniref:AAA family ATPase n=1 Tax=Candidatus Sulfurimonas marisnigri TaxID=2740405 RepID=A0A7S7LYV0_9BACT|nr:AAA family ATPase [Candidatus Sulfurimonas marisnigri]QOY53972.1 AAA family ATPase [Candidatus Sulfurimonas marisnigri]
MKVIFNNKEYRKNGNVVGNDGDGLGRLCFDIFKYYLSMNPGKTYKELQDTFNVSTIHKQLSGQNSQRKVIFNEADFQNWFDNHANNDSKKNERYFGKGNYGNPIEYNSEKLYFTTQWGNRDGNIDKMINFAKQQSFNINILDNHDGEEPELEFPEIKNIILYGAPGVGKTHNYKKIVALIEGGDFLENKIFDFIINNKDDEIEEGSIDRLFKQVKDEKRVEFITFHQSYSYEDFIEGFRPSVSGNIELKDGIFKKLCSGAEKSDKNFYIVIDEINRGNISKIFGELITLIEEDKRDVYEVTLPYSKEKFKVPSNLYIIATMNSTDKSIATIDIALRRRFTFLKMKPNENLILHVEAKKLFNDLNKFIKENLNEDYMLGHSYFMKIQTTEDLEFTKEYKIKPLLEEYFYADEDNYNKAIKIFETTTTQEEENNE